MYWLQQPKEDTQDPDEFETIERAMASLPGVFWNISCAGYEDEHLQGWIPSHWRKSAIISGETPDYTIIKA